jgi:hypothetical protein
MNNVAALTQTADAIQSADNELEILDALSRAVVTAQKTIQSLEFDIMSIHSNEADLDGKTRTNRLTSATSALSLAQSDLKSAQAAVTTQRAKTLAAGNLAATKVKGVRDRLFQKRRKNTETWIRDVFATNRIPCAVSVLVGNHRSVAAIKQLVAGSDYYAIGISPDAKIQALRELGRRFAELKPIAENVPGLVLDPQPEPVAEPVAESQLAEA